MTQVISKARVAQVNLGIKDVTYDGDDLPMIDGEGAIEIAYIDGRKEVWAAGSDAKIAEFKIRGGIEGISIPLLEAGSDAILMMFGGLSGGGSAPSLAATAPLIVTTLVGTFTAWAASPVGETTILISDQNETKPVFKFSCMADLDRDKGEQVWTFDPA